MQKSFWWRLCSVRYSLPLPPTFCDLGPRQYLSGDNSALNKFNQSTNSWPLFKSNKKPYFPREISENFLEKCQVTGPLAQKWQGGKNKRTRLTNDAGDRKGESNDSPEIPARRGTSDIVGLDPSGAHDIYYSMSDQWRKLSGQRRPETGGVPCWRQSTAQSYIPSHVMPKRWRDSWKLWLPKRGNRGLNVVFPSTASDRMGGRQGVDATERPPRFFLPRSV